ncbi:hypothetical protein BE20_19300 [Sorangium cellulosum]|nr:hypothetical protein BE20_19300 [Sorangium cellulosum]
MYVHQVLAPWSESDVTWNNLGAIDPASFTSFVPNVTGWSSVDLTGLVQDWVSGVSPSYGILLEEGSSGKTSYKGSAHTDLSYRPLLEVCYTAPKGTIGDPASSSTSSPTRTATDPPTAPPSRRPRPARTASIASASSRRAVTSSPSTTRRCRSATS